jgi:hypothetical protein
MKWPVRLTVFILALLLIIFSAVKYFHIAQANNLDVNTSPTALNLPTGSVTAIYSQYLYQMNTDASFHITLSGFGSGFDVQTNTIYLGWCLEDFPTKNSSSVILYSSYDPAMPANLKTYTDDNIPVVLNHTFKSGDPVPWAEVNWILNNKNAKGAATRDDVQNAIHLTVWGTATSTGSISPTASALAAEARNHNSFVPNGGQIIGVILYADGLSTSTSAIYQDTIIEVVLPPHPSLNLVKFTNGATASDPNGSDVPQIKPGDPVVWTYKVTNTGNMPITKASVSVTDNQTGVTPAFDQELAGNADAIFNPGEIWQYKATGIAVDLVLPPAGTIVTLNACTLQGTQPARSAYTNTGTASIPGATDAKATSNYCNPPVPSVSIVKYTNGKTATDPNGGDVPQIRPGEPVTWTYKVTNTGMVPVAKADVVVTDNETGVTPVYDKELSGNGDAVFDPGEVWQFTASSAALDLSLASPGITIVHLGCSYLGSMPSSQANMNTATASIPGASAKASSSYCNPVHYPYYGENGYIGVEDWYDGDYDYNDFGMYFRMEEEITYQCNNGNCAPYLTRVIVTTTSVIHDSSMNHLIHLRRPFNGTYSYTVTRAVPADPTPLVLFDGASGQETPAGSYTGSGDLNVVLYNTAKYGRSQKNIGEQVVIDITLDTPLLNPRATGPVVRHYTTGSATFTDLDPIMSNYDFWEEGTLYQSRWHLADTRPITTIKQSFGSYARLIPAGTVVPFMVVIPYTNWIPPFESSTITGPYGSFVDFYSMGLPIDWYIPDRVTNSCVIHGGLSFGPYPGQSGGCGNVAAKLAKGHIYLPVINH